MSDEQTFDFNDEDEQQQIPSPEKVEKESAKQPVQQVARTQPVPVASEQNPIKLAKQPAELKVNEFADPIDLLNSFGDLNASDPYSTQYPYNEQGGIGFSMHLENVDYKT